MSDKQLDVSNLKLPPEESAEQQQSNLSSIMTSPLVLINSGAGNSTCTSITSPNCLSFPPAPCLVEAGSVAVNEPNRNDVLAGRGSRINNHEGNVRFRQFVLPFKLKYLDKATKKIEKAHMCANIVNYVRSLNPPGRFLEKDPATGLWTEMGDERARKKAGQALREDATEIRAELGLNLKSATPSPQPAILQHALLSPHLVMLQSPLKQHSNTPSSSCNNTPIASNSSLLEHIPTLAERFHTTGSIADECLPQHVQYNSLRAIPLSRSIRTLELESQQLVIDQELQQLHMDMAHMNQLLLIQQQQHMQQMLLASAQEHKLNLMQNTSAATNTTHSGPLEQVDSVASDEEDDHVDATQEEEQLDALLKKKKLQELFSQRKHKLPPPQQPEINPIISPSPVPLETMSSEDAEDLLQHSIRTFNASNNRMPQLQLSQNTIMSGDLEEEDEQEDGEYEQGTHIEHKRRAATAFSNSLTSTTSSKLRSSSASSSIRRSMNVHGAASAAASKRNSSISMSELILSINSIRDQSTNLGASSNWMDSVGMMSTTQLAPQTSSSSGSHSAGIYSRYGDMSTSTMNTSISCGTQMSMSDFSFGQTYLKNILLDGHDDEDILASTDFHDSRTSLLQDNFINQYQHFFNDNDSSMSVSSTSIPHSSNTDALKQLPQHQLKQDD